MRVDWRQELDGRTLLEIRGLLRSLRRTEPFNDVVFAQVAAKSYSKRSLAELKEARRTIEGLLFSNLIEQADGGPPGSYEVSRTGISLCAASATKRFARSRADKAIETLQSTIAQINSDPIFLHDVAWVAVYGSYLEDMPDLGDIDLAIELKARWKPGRLGEENTDRERRTERFESRYPPPESFYEKHWWRSWPETYTHRMLRVDPAMKVIERSQLEELGCPHRQIFPDVVEMPAKPDWSCERHEIILVKPDSTISQEPATMRE